LKKTTGKLRNFYGFKFAPVGAPLELRSAIVKAIWLC